MRYLTFGSCGGAGLLLAAALLFPSAADAANCAGDCDADGVVRVSEIITMVKITLGSSATSACASGIPSVAGTDISLIIKAVNNAPNACLSGSTLPSTAEEIAASVHSSAAIAAQSGALIEDAIAEADRSNGDIHPDVLASSIAGLSGVAATTTNASGSVIVVDHSDGTASNILLVDQADPRLFSATAPRSTAPAMAHRRETTTSTASAVFPGGQNALILAPFQQGLNKDLDQYQAILEAAGFTVTRFEDSAANLEKFRGTYLAGFDVVFIDTHGGSGGVTRDHRTSTVIATGEVQSESRDKSLTHDEYAAIGTCGVSGGGAVSYYCVTPQWLRLSAAHFNDTYVLASACETSATPVGSSSLEQAFFDLGAGGYSGFEKEINGTLCGAIDEELLANLAAAESLMDATDSVHGDLALRLYAWFLRLLTPGSTRDFVSVDLLNSGQRVSSDDYFIVDPDMVVGESTLTPNNGPVGTAVSFDVYIRPAYISRVLSVAFDIDNTQEHLDTYEVEPGHWQQTALHAPFAEVYPRVDTFTWTAYDLGAQVVGSGSSTFTISGEPGASNVVRSAASSGWQHH